MMKKVYTVSFESNVNEPIMRGIYSEWRFAFQSMLHMLSKEGTWVIEGDYPSSGEDKIQWVSTTTGEILTVWIEEFVIDDKYTLPPDRYRGEYEE